MKNEERYTGVWFSIKLAIRFQPKKLQPNFVDYLESTCTKYKSYSVCWPFVIFLFCCVAWYWTFNFINWTQMIYSHISEPVYIFHTISWMHRLKQFFVLCFYFFFYFGRINEQSADLENMKQQKYTRNEHCKWIESKPNQIIIHIYAHWSEPHHVSFYLLFLITLLCAT